MQICMCPRWEGAREKKKSVVNTRVRIGDWIEMGGVEAKAGHSSGRANIQKSKQLKRVWRAFCTPQGSPQFQSSN